MWISWESGASSSFRTRLRSFYKRAGDRNNWYVSPLSVFPDSYFTNIEHHTVEVEKHACAKMDVKAIVAIERWLHPYGIASAAK